MIETLVENAKYMPQDGDDGANNGPSVCEVECKSQQASLVSCMNAIRDAEENDTSGTKGSNVCLAPSVAAWTECCALANGVVSWVASAAFLSDFLENLVFSLVLHAKMLHMQTH